MVEPGWTAAVPWGRSPAFASIPTLHPVTDGSGYLRPTMPNHVDRDGGFDDRRSLTPIFL